MLEEKVKNKRVAFLALFVLLLFIVSLFTFIIMYSVEIKIRQTRFDEIMHQESRVSGLEEAIFGEFFGAAISDLNYVVSMFNSRSESEFLDKEFIDNLTDFSFETGLYSEIRYIDIIGDEKIKINLGNTNSYVVDELGLNNVLIEDYFLRSSTLRLGSIYISPLRLCKTGKSVEVPYKPVVQFCAPLHNEDGKPLGIIVLDYLAKPMLNNFKTVAATSNGDVALLNSKGDWLSSSQISREWNFMFEGRAPLTFAFYHEEWDLIKVSDDQVITDNGLFTFTTVDLSEKIMRGINANDKNIHLGDGKFYIVTYIERNEETKGIFYDRPFSVIKDVFLENFYNFVLIFLLCALVTYLGYMYSKAFIKAKIHSEYDSLTQLYNRRMGTWRLEELLVFNERRKMSMSVCFIDVNGLKQVNDELGHKVGDELIITIAKVIKECIRVQDFAARMGGDEFIILFYGSTKSESEIIWERIVERFRKINSQEDRNYIISASHGIVSCDKNALCHDADELIKIADERMYEEKRKLKQTLHVIRRSKRK